MVWHVSHTVSELLLSQNEFLMQHQWTAHQHAIDDCRQQALDQMVYFLYRDLIFMRDVSLFLLRTHVYRQDLPEGQLCLYFVYSRADFGVFRPAD